MPYAAKAQFFHASEPEKGDDIPVILRSIAEIAMGDRERSISRYIVARLEEFGVDGDFVYGDLCRKQTEDIPPAAGPAGLNAIELGVGHGLGYLAAFRYHIPTRCLLLERNKMSISKVRLSLYLKKFNSESAFNFSEVFKSDVWDTFNNGDIRRIKIGIASPKNLEAIEAGGVAILRSASALAEAYNGISINLEVSVGRDRKASLDKGPVRRAVEEIINNWSSDARTIQVVAADEDGSHLIDFLGDQLTAERQIDFGANDIGARYTLRRDFLKEEFDAKLPYLQGLFG